MTLDEITAQFPMNSRVRWKDAEWSVIGYQPKPIMKNNHLIGNDPTIYLLNVSFLGEKTIDCYLVAPEEVVIAEKSKPN